MNDTNNTARLDAILIVGYLILLAAVILILSDHPIPKDNMSLFAALAMGVHTGLGIYIGYRWGSSRGSAMKDQALADAAKGSGQ